MVRRGRSRRRPTDDWRLDLVLWVMIVVLLVLPWRSLYRYELFHPRLVEYLLEHDFSVNLAPGHVVCFRDHARKGWEDELEGLWSILPPRLRG